MADTLTIARSPRSPDLPDRAAAVIANAIGRSVVKTAATQADGEVGRRSVETGIERLRDQVLAWSVGTRIALRTSS